MLLPDLNFATLKALKPVEIVINEASRALKDQNRVISSSEIANVLRVTRQITNEEDIFFRAIYAYGTGKSSNPGKYVPPEDVGSAIVGKHLPFLASTLIEGLLVLAGSILFLVFRRKKIKQKEQKLYDQAIAKEKSLHRQLQLEAGASQERIDYLKSVLVLLTYALKDLKQDLKVL